MLNKNLTVLLSVIIGIGYQSSLNAQYEPEKSACARSVYQALTSNDKNSHEKITQILKECGSFKPQCLSEAKQIAFAQNNAPVAAEIQRLESEAHYHPWRWFAGGAVAAVGAISLWGASIAFYVSDLMAESKKRADKENN